MFRSFLSFAVICVIAFTAAGCSTQKPQGKRPLPVANVRTATMDITPGLEVLARIPLPGDFAPSPDYSPMWLQSGKEVAIVGTRAGHTVVFGYGGAAFGVPRVIAEDGGIGAPDGNIVDVAPSPDGMVLALAVYNPKDQRLDVVARDVISDAGAHPVSSFDGDFDIASVGWINQFTIGLALRVRAPDDAAISDRNAPTTLAIAAPASSGLYPIVINGPVTAGYLKLNCNLSHLSWSSNGNYAAGEGDRIARPVIVDRPNETCQRLNANPPIRVLDWSPDGNSFLYEETNSQHETGTYRYDVLGKATRLIAVASGAAIFVGNSDVLALGSRGLTFGKIRNAPDAPCRAEVALSNASGNETDVESLGFNTTPTMLAASTMTYSRESDSAAIATFSPTPGGPQRKLVVYSVAAQRAFLIAFGPARGGLTMSWSNHGRYLAIADGDSYQSALTIVAPPR